MPQMSPYNWINLFLLFNILMIYMTSFIHFSMIKLPLNPNSPKSQVYNFKWMW